MGFWDIDYEILPSRLLPVRLRKLVQLAWLKVQLKPIKDLYEQFTELRVASLYELAHNGQICYLEAALNDAFDPIDREIYIEDGWDEDPIWLALAAELEPLELALASEDDPIWLPTAAETFLLAEDFVVMVPDDVAALPDYDELRVRALVDKYRIAGKGVYSVVTYTP